MKECVDFCLAFIFMMVMFQHKWWLGCLYFLRVWIYIWHRFAIYISVVVEKMLTVVNPAECKICQEERCTRVSESTSDNTKTECINTIIWKYCYTWLHIREIQTRFFFTFWMEWQCSYFGCAPSFWGHHSGLLRSVHVIWHRLHAACPWNSPDYNMLYSIYTCSILRISITDINHHQKR